MEQPGRHVLCYARICFVSILFTIWCSSAVLHQGSAYYLDAHPSAVCLDGTPGLYYFRKGLGDGVTKFLIYHEGGGFCTSHEDCAKRADGYFGSSAGSPSRRYFGDVAFFSTHQKENPLMWNWIHIYVRYCDGAYFSGERDDVVKVMKKSLHYKGRWITEALVQDLLLHHGFDKATDVVFSGCSAGAIHIFAHLDALRNLVPQHVRVTGLADSGFYLDVPMFTSLKRFVVTQQRATSLLKRECLENHRGAEEKCLLGSVVASHLETPLFVWQSRYDTDQRMCEMNETCADSEQCIREYGERLTSELHNSLQARRSSGGFLDSCSRHCQGPRLPVDDVTGQTPLQAFAQWYEGHGTQLYGQAASYPCGDCCGGLETDAASIVIVS